MTHIQIPNATKSITVRLNEEENSDCYIIIGRFDNDDIMLAYCKSLESVKEQFVLNCKIEEHVNGYSIFWARKNRNVFSEYEEIQIRGRRLI